MWSSSTIWSAQHANCVVFFSFSVFEQIARFNLPWSAKIQKAAAETLV